MTERHASYGDDPPPPTPAIMQALVSGDSSTWLKTALISATDRPAREALADARQLLQLLETWAGGNRSA